MRTVLRVEAYEPDDWFSMPVSLAFPQFMDARYETKEAAREAIWDALEEKGVARFPFPPHGRIPNFEDASAAAARLFERKPFSDARRLKINPDAPQRYVRIEALRRGCVVFVPTPRLRDGFRRLDPADIPDDDISSAGSLSKMDQWAEAVSLDELPQLDAIVTGSVAVARTGLRCGKGEGYSDLEYAILRELGHDPVPVATTVHPIQAVESIPTDAHDLPLSWIVTPEESIPVEDPPAAPAGVDWDALSDEDLEAMPVLRELREKTG